MTTGEVLRPASGGLKARLAGWAMSHVGVAFRILRALWPIPRFGRTAVVTRYDDVREVFLADAAFPVSYREKLDVIMGGHPFFLGMGDTPEYRRDTEAMRKVVRREDIPERLAPAVERLAEQVIASAAGRIEVVDALVRRITFDVLCDYFGTPDPPDGDLRVWATRLFEFQFADPGNDPSLRREVDEIAPALLRHVQELMDRRRTSGLVKDDVLGRCLAMQARQEPGFSDDQIRSALIGFVVGGLPQPPMVVPQALEQLLRRPEALLGAQDAARRNDDTLLAGYVFEAMRFDPLGPALTRVAAEERTIAPGTSRAATLPKGTTVLVAFSSAMMDERRVPEPQRFNPRRLPHEYMHFGQGLHTCFGIHMNQALLPLMLKPLLRRRGLRRTPGADGHLVKRGAFADRLWVEYDPR
ncbi:MAG: cytochrome P450 [Pseudomonadota bacterium]|nr:cytochrome P450 [Pseudomonadota bacterium]